VASIVLCISSLAADEKTIDAKDAAQHAGETVVVTGTIAEAHQFKGGSSVLNCDNRNQVFGLP
jgi:hypothetical protein